MFSEMRGRDRNLGMGNAPARTLHAILQRRCILSQVPRGTCPVYSTHDQVLIYCVLIPTEQLFTCLCTSTTTGPQQGRNILRFHSLHCIMHCIAYYALHHIVSAVVLNCYYIIDATVGNPRNSCNKQTKQMNFQQN